MAEQATEQVAGSVGSIMDQVGKLTDEERQELIANLVKEYKKEVQQESQESKECILCDDVLSTEHRRSYGYLYDDYCDNCIPNCICGEGPASRGGYQHGACYHHNIRCYCGEVIHSEPKWKVHGPQCSRLAQLRFSIQGDPTIEQRKAISGVLTNHEMVEEEGDWVSTRAYPVEAFTTFRLMTDAYPRSLFGESCIQQLAYIPLEFVELTLLFTHNDGWVETKTLKALNVLSNKLGVPDPDSDEVYKSLAIRMVMKVPERTVKKLKKARKAQ